jgi:hypothetical protein
MIQYQPATETVRELPLLIVPPTINKYYILDLAPGRSMIEYLTAQGQQVFVMSWRNPDERGDARGGRHLLGGRRAPARRLLRRHPGQPDRRGASGPVPGRGRRGRRQPAAGEPDAPGHHARSGPH